VPTATQFVDADITDLESLRGELEPRAEAAGIRLTLLAFVIKACTLALRECPDFNASLDTACETLILKKYCNIGFAVDTPAAMVAPVIRDADRLSTMQIADAIGDLAGKARAGCLLAADIEGGCFSVINLGAIGGSGFTPAISAPELAALGMGHAARRLIEVSGAFVPRMMLPLALACDRRMIDAVSGGRFLHVVRSRLQEPASLL
jgi:pyruvate dehydrogenase E2 component (dihydrolipoamide acetyltransferase)